jgi:ABC-type transporter Mla MlaB component
VDAGEVEQVDGAVLQLFASFVPAAETAGVFVEWQAVSDAFRAAADRLGLAALLQLPSGGGQ